MTNTANTALTLAAAGLALVDVAQSVLGELLLFRRLRTQGRQTAGRGGWHCAAGAAHPAPAHSAGHLACGFGTVLGTERPALAPGHRTLGRGFGRLGRRRGGRCALASGVLVFFATHGRHPAWCALLVIATLVWWR